jgi:leader peptidase (prepilin peptidase)/N-methyltransferase
MQPGTAVVVVAGICCGAAFAGWRLPEAGFFLRMLAAARSAGADSSSAPVISPAEGWPSPAWVRAAAVAAAAGAAAGALTTGVRRHFLENVWLVPWAAMAALLAAVDLSERVVPTAAARAASVATLVLAVSCCAGSGDWSPVPRALGCAAVVWALLAAWSVLSPCTLGFGDARVAFLVALGAGAISPARALAALAGAHFAAGLWSKLRTCLGHWREGAALGPFLAVAGIAVVVAGGS